MYPFHDTRALHRAGLTTTAILVAGLTARSSLADGSGHDGYQFSVVATLDEAPPGDGRHLNYFEPQDINASGVSIFVSGVGNGLVGDALYLRRKGVNQLIARSGMPAPGAGVDYANVRGVMTPSGLNDAGNVAFGFVLDIYPSDQEIEPGLGVGIFRYTRKHGVVTPVILPGQPVPGNATFLGGWGNIDINNRNEIVGVGFINTSLGNCTDPNALCYGLGRGVFLFDEHDVPTRIAAPGDRAPGGDSVFDDAWDPKLNDRGDVVFGAHVSGETCVGGDASTIGCFESLYLYRASTGTLTSLVHQGDATPEGALFDAAWNGQINNAGDVSFIGFAGDDSGVYLHDHNGRTVTVAMSGASLPGGTMTYAPGNRGCHGINGAGQVAFSAALDADINFDSVPDTGVYLYDDGEIRTVVRTGTVIPGVGTVAHVNNNDDVSLGSAYPWPLVHLNDRGQVLTQVILTTGVTHVVVATPD
ncbi:choice-of-anchor tandem repeat NxxGxxAF-containing protein [Sorangium sp. So ce726]|uniref:DUF7453 family protein n=1 Tax=Sorangium sp. So ce726 TaxID=3133319 RepID=UPI003F61FAE2